jgi:hypothetical protein
VQQCSHTEPYPAGFVATPVEARMSQRADTSSDRVHSLLPMPMCTICRSTICSSARPMYQFPCGHAFHTQCTDQWFALGTRKSCPNCNQVVASTRRLATITSTNNRDDGGTLLPASSFNKRAAVRSSRQRRVRRKDQHSLHPYGPEFTDITAIGTSIACSAFKPRFQTLTQANRPQHRLIGRRVSRHFPGFGMCYGTVVSCLIAGIRDGGDLTIRYDDGDKETFPQATVEAMLAKNTGQGEEDEEDEEDEEEGEEEEEKGEGEKGEEEEEQEEEEADLLILNDQDSGLGELGSDSEVVVAGVPEENNAPAMPKPTLRCRSTDKPKHGADPVQLQLQVVQPLSYGLKAVAAIRADTPVANTEGAHGKSMQQSQRSNSIPASWISTAAEQATRATTDGRHNGCRRRRRARARSSAAQLMVLSISRNYPGCELALREWLFDLQRCRGQLRAELQAVLGAVFCDQPTWIPTIPSCFDDAGAALLLTLGRLSVAAVVLHINRPLREMTIRMMGASSAACTDVQS